MRSLISPARLASLGLGLALCCGASAASAQHRLDGYDWRRGTRDGLSESDMGPQRLALELRFGPYYPQIDDEFAASPGPYETAFDTDPMFYIGLEVDWQALRIPYVGVLGPGFGAGYTHTSTVAHISGCTVTSSTNCESGQDTSLTIYPMHLSAVLRLDEPMRRLRIPIVPYGKLGLGLGLWKAGTTDGTSTHDGVVGRDTTWGTHMALGGMLALNMLDPHATSNLYESAGIHHAYLFGEWMNAKLDGLGDRPQMHIGTTTWVVGLAADL